jgi:hypothetical protein
LLAGFSDTPYFRHWIGIAEWGSMNIGLNNVMLTPSNGAATALASANADHPPDAGCPPEKSVRP